MPPKSIRPGPRYRALLELLRAAESLWNASRVFFGRWDLSPSQFNVLNLLGDQPQGLSQSELSRELIMHRSNLTGLVDRLEKRGLVARHESAGDRRAWRVVLTARGRRLWREILPWYFQVAEEVWGNIQVDRSHALAAELRQLGVEANRLAVKYAAEP